MMLTVSGPVTVSCFTSFRSGKNDVAVLFLLGNHLMEGSIGHNMVGENKESV